MNWFLNWLTREDKPCKTCAALQEQLEYERSINKEMLETITSLLKPQPVIQQQIPEPRPIGPRGVLWSRRRAELERQDRERIKAERSPFAAKSDKEVKPPEPEEPKQKTIEQLELELGVTETSDAVGG